MVGISRTCFTATLRKPTLTSTSAKTTLGRLSESSIFHLTQTTDLIKATIADKVVRPKATIIVGLEKTENPKTEGTIPTFRITSEI